MNDKELFSKGLTSAQAAEQIKNGNANIVKNTSNKSYFSIVVSNVFTYFNAIFALIAILLISVGSYKNLSFLPVIVANMIIGIFQQARSKAILDKLTLLDKAVYTVIRDGAEVKLLSDKLVSGDLIKLEAGQQIPADCTVISGEILANESLLTGESDEIEKHENSELLSGSFVVSGSCYATLTKVGINSYSAKLTAQAKEIKDKKSEMIKDIDRIILCAGIIIIPLGILLFCQSHFGENAPLNVSISNMAGAIIGMIPEGLHLLTTIALALSAIRLAQNQVLLHDMRSIETLARVDVLCVDKTGTITSEKMTVSGIVFPESEFDSEEKKQNALAIFKAYTQSLTDQNATMQAIKQFLESGGKFYSGKLPSHDELSRTSKDFKPQSIENFNSKTKFSAITTENAVYKLGAPEFILPEESLKKHNDVISEHAENGERVLAFCKLSGANAKPEFCFFVCLNNEIRENARDIFSYFAKQGVEIKVISGDNPLTVSKVAQKAGIINADKCVDASTLFTDDDIADAVKTYTVFGRVKPEQKKQIILALKAAGQKVAMTGDGVNDILAMKEADCSISMGSGSDAAREASQVVLMDSDFSHMKNIVSEGRRDINNITRTATLFLYKNIFSVVLAVYSLIIFEAYPLEPVKVSFISLFNVGLPAFLLTLEPNEKKQKGKFITETLIRAFPAALGAFLSRIIISAFGKRFGVSENELSTLTLYLLATAGYLLLFQAMRPVTLYRIIVAAICVGGFVATVFILGDFVGLARLGTNALIAWLALAVFEAIITFSVPLLVKFIRKRKEKKNT